MHSRRTIALLVLGDNDLLEHDKGEVGEGAKGHQDGTHQVKYPGRGQDSQPVKLKLFFRIIKDPLFNTNIKVCHISKRFVLMFCYD